MLLRDRRINRNAVFILLLLDEVADSLVFDEERGKFFFRSVPTALPIFHNADAKRDGIDHLTHDLLVLVSNGDFRPC